MASAVSAYVTDVEGLTLRSMAGEGDQVEAVVRRKGGTDLVLRLIAARGKVIRVTDLRANDKASKRHKGQKSLTSVPFQDVIEVVKKARKQQ